MANINTSEVLNELTEVLKANTAMEYVDHSVPVTPIAQETFKTAAYVNLIKVVPRIEKASIGMDGYIFHGLFSVTLNVDCTDDKNLVYDLVDSLQRSVLNDAVIWSKLVDRDLLAVEYDNCEFNPKRVATMVIEVKYTLLCE